VLGTLAGPGMPRAQPNLKFYGTDLGWSFQHKDKHFILFGDTWPDAQHVCQGDPRLNDDSMATLPVEYSGSMPQLEFFTRKDAPNDLEYIHVYRGEESLPLGFAKAPVAGWSDGKHAFAMFERFTPHPCDADYAQGSQACPIDDHFQCSTTLGLCDPADLPIPVVCEVGNDATCLPGERCVAATLCVDPSSSQFGDGQFAGQERSVAHTLEIAVARDDSPTAFDSVLAFATSKFSIPTVRTISGFSGKLDGNDYSPGHDRLLVWGRPGLTAEHERDARLYLMTHTLPLDRGTDGKLKFAPRYFAGIDPKNGEPTWSDRQSEAKAIALDGAPNGDPHESVQVLMNMSLSWLGEPINKWVMLYGGDMPDWLLTDPPVSRGSRTPGAIWMRFADHPWGPFSTPIPHLAPGTPLRINDPYGPGGYLYNASCRAIGSLTCAPTDPRRPLDSAVQGCPFATEDPGRLYAPSIIDNYTRPNAKGGLDIVWNVSTWNPYAIKLMQTSVMPPGSAAPPQDELADADALRALSRWEDLPSLERPHGYQQQTSYDRGTEDHSYPLSNHGNQDFNNFVCKSGNADVAASQITPPEYDLPECAESYVRGVVLARFEGAGHMARMWLGLQSLLFGPADDEVLRIYVDDDPRPRVDVPLVEALDGRAGEIFAPPFGAGSASRLAWYYPVSFRKKLIVALDRIGESDAVYYHCDVVPDVPSDKPVSADRLPEREAALQQLTAVFHPAGTHGVLADPLDLELGSGETHQLQLKGPATIHELQIRVAEASVARLRDIRVAVRWDGASESAIDLSLADLLGGSVPPENSSQALTSIVETGDRVLALKLPMPFRREAAIAFENMSERVATFGVRVVGESKVPDGEFGHLHATRTETVGPTTAAERTAVSVKGRGRLVGMCTEVQGHADRAAGIQYDQLNLLEGDVRARADGELVLNGTGSEETADDVFYFHDAPYANAFAQTWGIVNDRNQPPGRASFCSWHVLGRELDFKRELDVTIELGGAGNPTIVERHKTVAYFYLAD
jgi:hypothetical protein